MFKQYNGVASIFKIYWTAYGGLGKLLGSPYLHAAVLLLLVTVYTWSGMNSEQGKGWWDDAISVMPNLLGFTLGGFAMFIGFGNEKFKALLADSSNNAGVNDFVALCAMFVHFILVQASALLVAIVGKSLAFYTPLIDPIRDWLPYLNFFGGAFGYGLFLYALTSVLAVTMHLFRIARIYALFQDK